MLRTHDGKFSEKKIISMTDLDLNECHKADQITEIAPDVRTTSELPPNVSTMVLSRCFSSFLETLRCQNVMYPRPIQTHTRTAQKPFYLMAGVYIVHNTL